MQVLDSINQLNKELTKPDKASSGDWSNTGKKFSDVFIASVANSDTVTDGSIKAHNSEKAEKPMLCISKIPNNHDSSIAGIII